MQPARVVQFGCLILLIVAVPPPPAAMAADPDDKEYVADFQKGSNAAKKRIEGWSKKLLAKKIDLDDKKYADDFKWLAGLAKSKEMAKSVTARLKEVDLKFSRTKGTPQERMIRELLVGVWVGWRVENADEFGKVANETDFALAAEKYLGTLADVYIKSDPDEASIEVDGLDQGTTENVIALRVKKEPYTVVIKKDGYSDKEQKAIPVPGKITAVDAKLKKPGDK